jgi:Ribbon-helix-helix domain
MVSRAKGKQTQVTSYFDPEAVRMLQQLSEITRVPQAAYLREALDDLLMKYRGTLRKLK